MIKGLPDINIWSIVVGSMIDFPSTPAIVLFTKGCNMQCGFCHNLFHMANSTAYEPDIVHTILDSTPLCDGVVISGGEPCLQNSLESFLEYLKNNFSFKVKLDTNGTFPDVLQKVYSRNLVDYVAMDIKGEFETYDKHGYGGNAKDLYQSVDIIRNSNIPYMFRTTLDSSITEQDREWIKNNFNENEIKYQQYRPIKE